MMVFEIATCQIGRLFEGGKGKICKDGPKFIEIGACLYTFQYESLNM